MASLRTAAGLLAFVVVALTIDAQSIFTFAGGGTDDGRPATVAAIAGLGGIATDSEGNLYVTDSLLGYVRRVDADTGLIVTVAGVGTLFGLSGDGGPATLAELGSVREVAISTDAIYTAETGRVRRIDRATGLIETFAGGGSDNPGDGGPATAAKLDTPVDITLDAAGNVYIADTGQDRVRRVDLETGIISTIAGNGTEGFDGDGGAATSAALFDPSGVAIDSSSNVWIADRGNHRIRRIDGSSGVISTVAGTGNAGFSGDGGPGALAQLDEPVDVAVDSDGTLWIADRGNHRCRRIDSSSGEISTFAGNGSTEFSGDEDPATEAGIGTLSGVAADRSLNVLLASDGHGRVRSVDRATGMISTVAGNGEGFYWGDGSPATAAGLWVPGGVVADREGNVYAGSWLRVVRRIDATTGIITVFAGNGEAGRGGDGGPALKAQLSRPAGLAVDRSGNLYISDRETRRVRKVNADTGVITTVAGGGTRTGNGIPATEARLTEPHGIAVDGSGNLFIADNLGFVVRRVDATNGSIRTVAGNGTPIGDIFFDDGFAATLAGIWPEDVAVDSDGDLYIADYINAAVRRVDQLTGIITTHAGSGFPGYGGDGLPATEAFLFDPVGIAFDDSDNLFIADQFNNRVRRVDGQTGIITTVAGNGDWAYAGDGGAATLSSVTFVNGVATDADGALYLSDLSSNRIRVVEPCREIQVPSLTSPSDGSSGVSLSPVLSWNPVKRAVRFDVYLDRVNPPSRVVGSRLENTSFSPSNLQPLTTYYWKIVAEGDPFCTPSRNAESEVRSFTTASECTSPGGSSR